MTEYTSHVVQKPMTCHNGRPKLKNYGCRTARPEFLGCPDTHDTQSGCATVCKDIYSPIDPTMCMAVQMQQAYQYGVNQRLIPEQAQPFATCESSVKILMCKN